jgi:hypothetical protein
MRELKPSNLARKYRGEAKRKDAERKRGGTDEPPIRVIWNPPCSRCPDPNPVHVRGSYRAWNLKRGPEPIKLCSICLIFYEREMLELSDPPF